MTSGTDILATLEPMIAAKQYGVVAAAIAGVSEADPNMARFLAKKLFVRILAHDPDFVAERSRQSPWLRQDMGWEKTIEKVAGDVERLPGKVYLALSSLRDFEVKEN